MDNKLNNKLDNIVNFKPEKICSFEIINDFIIDDEDKKKYIGMNIEEAFETSDKPIRIMRENDTNIKIDDTSYIKNRMNVVVKDNIITNIIQYG